MIVDNPSNKVSKHVSSDASIGTHGATLEVEGMPCPRERLVHVGALVCTVTGFQSLLWCNHFGFKLDRILFVDVEVLLLYLDQPACAPTSLPLTLIWRARALLLTACLKSRARRSAHPLRLFSPCARHSQSCKTWCALLQRRLAHPLERSKDGLLCVNAVALNLCFQLFKRLHRQLDYFCDDCNINNRSHHLRVVAALRPLASTRTPYTLCRCMGRSQARGRWVHLSLRTARCSTQGYRSCVAPFLDN